jgi:hypothetical protein
LEPDFEAVQRYLILVLNRTGVKVEAGKKRKNAKRSKSSWTSAN